MKELTDEQKEEYLKASSRTHHEYSYDGRLNGWVLYLVERKAVKLTDDPEEANKWAGENAEEGT